MSGNPLISKPSRIDSLIGVVILLGFVVMDGAPSLGLGLVVGAVTLLTLRLLEYRMKRGERRP